MCFIRAGHPHGQGFGLAGCVGDVYLPLVKVFENPKRKSLWTRPKRCSKVSLNHLAPFLIPLLIAISHKAKVAGRGSVNDYEVLIEGIREALALPSLPIPFHQKPPKYPILGISPWLMF